MVFDRFKRRHNLDKYNIHFHGLRHTFSNMLFEMNENPKVIQQLLGHRDVKTTILYEDERRRQEELENKKNDLLSNMTDEEYDDLLEQLLKERRARKRKRQNDLEM